MQVGRGRDEKAKQAPPPFGRSSNIKPAHKRRNKLNATNRPRGQLIDRHSGVAMRALDWKHQGSFSLGSLGTSRIFILVCCHIFQWSRRSVAWTLDHFHWSSNFTPPSLWPQKKRHNISLASFAVPAIWWVMCFHMPKNISNTKN